jgi:hypothetical protein
MQVNGDGNTLTINNVNDLVDQYNKLVKDNETIEAQKNQYFEDYNKVLEENENLKAQLKGSPSIELKNMGLYIDGSEININKNKSYAIIDGTEYFSREFINNLVDQNTTSMTIQDENLYLGKVVTDSANLLNQRIVDSSKYEIADKIVDSYGNTHISAGKFSGNGFVYYSLNEKYSLLKLSISIDEEADGDKQCSITIKADGEEVYTFSSLNKVSTKK